MLKGNDEKQASPTVPEPADTEVVVQKTEAEAVKYGDVTLYDACTMMPATLIEEVGFKAAAHGWHSQSYVPRSVPAADATIKDEIQAISSCLYEPMNGKEITRITLSIDQTPFNRLYQVNGPDKDETSLAVDGIKVFIKPDTKPDSFNARIISADSKVQAHLGARTMADNKEITDYRATFESLARRVAENFVKGPQGRTTHVHTGRYESVPNACDILSAELFQELTQSKDSGLVEADFHAPEGMEKFVHENNETRYYYSNQQDCRRLSPEWFTARDRSDGKALKVELRTYRDAEMAVKNAQDCNPNSPARGITGEAVLSDENIGDFATCSYLVGDSPTISFVAGRTQVRLTGYGDWAPDDPKQYVRQFAPIAKRMVDEVRKAIG
ncbi:hypothetical protein LFM09_14145 [Lentzea alba]|uniref:hypothetical protein n=1 Tax=Lentzea alba TaxID=2714351 RepID=UPI0039BF0FBD